MSKLKVAVIGIGNMGSKHVRVYSDIPGVKLVAFSRLHKHLLKRSDAKYYKNYKRMLDLKKPDIVSICLPISLHYQAAKECFKRGINVLLEKPITANVSQAEELLKLAKKYKVNFLVGHLERFNTVVKKAKEMIVKGDLGEIITISARRVGASPPQSCRESGIAIDVAIHDIDVVNYLLDNLPISVLVNKQRNKVDSCEFLLNYKNITAYIQANWVDHTKTMRDLDIIGTKGHLEVNYVTQEIKFSKSIFDKIKYISIRKKEPLKEEILYFINCVKKNIKIDSKFAVDALKIALKH